MTSSFSGLAVDLARLLASALILSSLYILGFRIVLDTSLTELAKLLNQAVDNQPWWVLVACSLGATAIGWDVYSTGRFFGTTKFGVLVQTLAFVLIVKILYTEKCRLSSSQDPDSDLRADGGHESQSVEPSELSDDEAVALVEEYEALHQARAAAIAGLTLAVGTGIGVSPAPGWLTTLTILCGSVTALFYGLIYLSGVTLRNWEVNLGD